MTLAPVSCSSTAIDPAGRTDIRDTSALREYPGFAPRDAPRFVLLTNKQSLVRDVVEYDCMAREGFDCVFQ